MMRGRVAYAGAIHEAYPDGNGVRLADGRVRREDEVVWLAPIEVGTIFALGLNYAEHAKELQFNKAGRAFGLSERPGQRSSVTAASRAALPMSPSCTTSANLLS